jgi:sugar-specific transcriptional regulator TrmB
MSLEKPLLRAGLTRPEAKVFLAGLELGEASVSLLAKKAGVKRPTTYAILESLKEKGLINSYVNRGKLVFFAEDPRLIERQLEEKKQAIHDILPELLSLTNRLAKKPRIHFYEGEVGTEEILRDILKYPNSEFCSWYSAAYSQFFDYSEFVHDYFIPKRLELHIPSRSIMPDTPASQPIIAPNAKELRQTKLIDPKYYSLNININLYGNSKLALVSYKEKISLIIESPEIFTALKGIFETMWHFLPGPIFPKP